MLTEQRWKGFFRCLRRLDELERMMFLLVRKDGACLVSSVPRVYMF